MSRYPASDHDAEWLLQIERRHNDRVLQAARQTGRRPGISKSPVTSIAAVEQISPWEAQAAAEFVRRRVEGEAVHEVLQMLGLEAL